MAGGKSCVPISQAKADAMAKLAAIDAGLTPRDRRIVRHVCGEGWWPSEAVREACGHAHYANAVTPRFIEALDSLIEAIAAAKRCARADAANAKSPSSRRRRGETL